MEGLNEEKRTRFFYVSDYTKSGSIHRNILLLSIFSFKLLKFLHMNFTVPLHMTAILKVL
jgi:hypothetical protein